MKPRRQSKLHEDGSHILNDSLITYYNLVLCRYVNPLGTRIFFKYEFMNKNLGNVLFFMRIDVKSRYLTPSREK